MHENTHLFPDRMQLYLGAVLMIMALLIGGGLALLPRHSGAAERPPRVAYLAPVHGTPQNIWIADPANPDDAYQVTFSESGIYNFAVSPEGDRIAFAEHNPDSGTIDLKMLNLDDGTITVLVTCPDSECKSPAWNPEGSMIAYERTIVRRNFSSLNPDPTSIWLLDLRDDPPTTRPLFNNPQILGHSPQWSPGGRRLAFYDLTSTGIRVYDFRRHDSVLIPSHHDSVGAFSPDGTQMAYLEIQVRESSGTHTRVRLADLTTGTTAPLDSPDEPVDDERVVWSPDGRYLALGRRYTDERYTPGRQIYRFDLETGEAEPLVVDAGYYHGYFAWDASGRWLVFQRFPDPGAQPDANDIHPEVWTVDTISGTLSKIATDVFLPQWVP